MNVSLPSGEASRGPSSEVALLLLTGAALVACSTVVSVPALPPPAANHPLPACDAPTNCVRASRSYPVPASTLFDAAQQALKTLGPTTHRTASDSLRASAVYRVGLLFRDDVTVAVTSQGDTSTLHVRSASRVGLYDLGVNRRRVRDLLDAVDRGLPSSGSR
ncbi:MAG: DUF1499 domain-containing protein [Salinibacter sp.]